MKKRLYLSKPRQATWLELFFDLIFVVALGKVTQILAASDQGHILPTQWVSFTVAFIPMWWIWVGHMVFSNRFDTDSQGHRLVTLFLMLIVMSLAMLLDDALQRHYKLFILGYTIARLVIAGLYFSVPFQSKEKNPFARQSAWIYGFGALISGSGVFWSSEGALPVLYGGMLFDALGQRLLISPSMPVDRDHLVERVGLLAIILLGESVISIAAGLTNIDWDPKTILAAVTAFLFIAMIWWIYFDSFPLLIESQFDPHGDAILFSQLLTYVSFAILANMIRHAILNDLDLEDFRILTAAGISCFYVGKQSAYYVNCPEYRSHILVNTLTMGVIAALAMLLEEAPYILLGAAFSMVVYIAMNARAQMKIYGKTHL